MGEHAGSASGNLALAEIREFASFSSGSQRYIRRALDVAFDRKDAVELWSRDAVEAASIKAQYRFYERLPALRALIPDSSAIEEAEPFMATPIERRKKLLQSISEAVATAPGWSRRAPRFFPEWVDKVEVAVGR
ncbi:MAG: hypothetical protein LW742_10145 [Sphingomonadales bacterium]|nr:hypothetical protein [Sphingomonadales bacterium]